MSILEFSSIERKNPIALVKREGMLVGLGDTSLEMNKRCFSKHVIVTYLSGVSPCPLISRGG